MPRFLSFNWSFEQHANHDVARGVGIGLPLWGRSGVGAILLKSSFEDIHFPGRPSHDPACLLTTVVLGFALGKATLRELENACRFDLRLKFIVGDEPPSHMAFQRFVNEVILPNADFVFFSVTKAIFGECGLDWDVAFVDATKQVTKDVGRDAISNL